MCLLGKKELAKFLAELNNRLPEEFRQEGRITGHSGRKTAVTIAINEGVDSVVVGSVTQHRDLNTLRRYANVDVAAQQRPVLSISNAIERVGEKRRLSCSFSDRNICSSRIDSGNNYVYSDEESDDDVGDECYDGSKKRRFV